MPRFGSVDQGTLDLETHMTIPTTPRLTLPRPHEA
jgi:hypothetical protein